MDSVFRTPQVHVIGEIIGASGFASTKVYARWRMNVGHDWRLLSGIDNGETFYDCTEHVEDISVFEHPLDLHYACKTISGWPKFDVEVWTVDTHGRHSIAGYGCLTLPMSPGQYELDVLLWRPEGGIYEKLTSFFLSANPELVHKNMVISGNDRFGLQTISTGKVMLRVGVIVKDFNLHGVLM
ncbi:unnamed protein product [Blepharisma stoltei]|uniref:B9 domain-containing protein 2 n=1 Tax=Blepharisma stoltei TaxID=1481888 RepID=A0AAU9K183_9CILI|nr:unnamed protein product [Blepharisma stoltei]